VPSESIPTPHPYMANSNPEAHQRMLSDIGVATVDELFEQIPADQITTHEFAWPPALRAESDLHQHVAGILRANANCSENLSFLGAGVYQHYVPAVVDTVISRSEFLTPIWGTSASDHGRMQAWFEFTSQLGELLEMDFVGLPVYSYGAAAGHAIRMAARMTGRDQVLVPRNIDPERLAVIRTYCGYPELSGYIELVPVEYVAATGLVDRDDLASKLSERTAAVYLENPNYFGIVESEGAAIAALARESGAETIVGVDPVSLGLLAPPSTYGADIVVGTIQTLGVHMNCGGGVAGFIATSDDERYARQFPTLQVSLGSTVVPGEKSFGLTLFEQTSYGARENGNDWTGNGVYLWAIAATVYLSLMGPSGLRDLGTTIVQRSNYAAQRLATIDGISVRWPSPFFREFVVSFDVGMPVEEIDRRLREVGIFGGKDLSRDFPELGTSALYCVTEVHSQRDIDRLVSTLRELVAS
jgi:glycine dehydrogenase subunit 1